MATEARNNSPMRQAAGPAPACRSVSCAVPAEAGREWLPRSSVPPGEGLPHRRVPDGRVNWPAEQSRGSLPPCFD